MNAILVLSHSCLQRAYPLAVLHRWHYNKAGPFVMTRHQLNNLMLTGFIPERQECGTVHKSNRLNLCGKLVPFRILHPGRLTLYGKCHDGFFRRGTLVFGKLSPRCDAIAPLPVPLIWDQAGNSSASASVRRVATSVMMPATAASEADSTAVR